MLCTITKYAGHFLFYNKNKLKSDGGVKLKSKETLMQSEQKNVKLIAKHKKRLRTLIATAIISIMLTMQVLAADDDIWTKAKALMQDIYNKILLISTAAAVVTAAVALLMMNFSKNGRTVDESRAWLKRIVITWIILNSLGFIVAYISPLVSGGQWTG